MMPCTESYLSLNYFNVKIEHNIPNVMVTKTRIHLQDYKLQNL